MIKVLVKFKNINDVSLGYIKASEFEAEGISDILKTLKLVDSIEIDGNYYRYSDSEFRPSLEHYDLNVLNVYLENMYIDEE